MKKNTQEIIIYNFCYLKIRCTRNNVFVTLTNHLNNVLAKSSAGIAQFSGKKKATAYVAAVTVEKLLLSLKDNNIGVKLLHIQFIG